VNGIKGYISEDPNGDRDLLLRGKKLEKATEEELKKLCFRNLFIEDEDLRIGKILEQYFLAVAERWPDSWNYRGPGRILNRTNGFRALSSIFGGIYTSLAEPGDFVTKDEFKQIFDEVEAPDEFFSTENFKPGSSGEAELKKFFIGQIRR